MLLTAAATEFGKSPVATTKLIPNREQLVRRRSNSNNSSNRPTKFSCCFFHRQTQIIKFSFHKKSLFRRTKNNGLTGSLELVFNLSSIAQENFGVERFFTPHIVVGRLEIRPCL